MKYAIFSDVHANLQALDAAIADARRMGAETFVSLGDTVGYGPLPAEALARVRETCSVALAGNHDDAVSGRCGADDFIGLASDAVERHRDALGADARAWLKGLPYVAELDGAICTHGDFVDPPKFYYIEDEADAAANFNTSDFTLAFIGHTHRPAIFLTGQSGTFYKTDPQDFALEDGKRYIVNPGSVGYPRESGGICRSSYVLYDSVARTVEFRFLPFAVSSVMQRGRSVRTRWKFLAGLGVAALAILAAAIFFATGSAPQDDPKLVLDKRTIVLPNAGAAARRTTELHANLKLSHKSAPVYLRIRFLAADCGTLTEHTLTVRKSSEKNLFGRDLVIPPNAKSVNLTVLRMQAKDTAQIVRFDPILR